jgi:MFS family permease
MTAEPAGRPYRRYVLGVLLVVYTLNFVDRQILGVLAIPIKAELGITDSRLGLLGGVAFALFYTLLGIPVARLADRLNRVNLLTIALAFWSAMTAMCGAVQSYSQLFLARMGVGIGEAGGLSPAYSIICDYFPRNERGRAMAIHSFGVPIGSALGIIAGGYLTQLMNWRTAFIVVGLTGVIVAPLVKLTVREPLRGGLDDRVGARAGSLLDVLRILRTKPSFWALALGTATSSMMSYGMLFWLPSFLVRSLSLTSLSASQAFAALTLVGGVTGIWCGGVLADRLGRRGPRAHGLIPAAAVLLAIPFYAIGLLADGLWSWLAWMLLPTALGLMWMGPVLSAVQQLVPAEMRATASAIFLFMNSLIGIGLGTVLIGALSDAMQLRFGADSLRYAILSGLALYIVAGALFMYGARHIERDWHQYGNAP